MKNSRDAHSKQDEEKKNENENEGNENQDKQNEIRQTRNEALPKGQPNWPGDGWRAQEAQRTMRTAEFLCVPILHLCFDVPQAIAEWKTKQTLSRRRRRWNVISNEHFFFAFLQFTKPISV